MNRLKIMIDMDGVLANFLLGYNMIEDSLGKERTPQTGSWEAFWNDDVWAIIKSSPDYWLDLPCLLSVREIEGLQDMVFNHDVYFVTARMGVKPKQQTELWLCEYSIPYPSVILTAGKDVADRKLYFSFTIGADFSIDDKLENVERIAKNANLVSILATTPQNTSAIWKPRMDTFQEFIDLVNEEAGK